MLIVFSPAFRCPWQNCGREFNVNSNMRRHYRNHTTPGFSRAQPNENRRRRRRSAQSVAQFLEPTGPPPPVRAQKGPYVATPPITAFGASDSEDSDSGDTRSYSRSHHDKEEEDELLDYEMEDPADYRAAASLAQSMERVAVAPQRRRNYEPQLASSHPHSYAAPHAHGRGMTPGSGFQSSSSSASPSPPSEHRYVPSMPYIRSMGSGPRVSTALRPAFHDGRTTTGRSVKGERMSEAW